MTLQSGRTETVLRRIHWEFYDDETPAALIKFFEDRILELENVNTIRVRYRIFYGNRSTGAWDKQLGPDTGYVAIATDERFMLLYNAASTTGPGIMMRFIVKIETTHDRQVVYRHPLFHEPTPADMEQEPVIQNTDERQASRIILRRRDGS